MNVIVDTSSWIRYFKEGELRIVDQVLREGRVVVPPVVVAELLSAKLSSSQFKSLKGFLDDLPLCDTPRDHWANVGKTRSLLARKGLNISTIDCHIAQCALDCDGYIVSEDKVFAQIPRHLPLKLLN